MNPFIQLILAFIGSLGFSMVFNVKKKYWIIIAINGMLSWGVYLLFRIVANDFISYFFSAAFCSLFAHITSKILKAPTTCLLISATVPMIPGGSLYYTMTYIISGNMVEFKKYALLTAEVIFAMSIGFAIVSLVFKLINNYSEKKHKI